MDTSDTLPNTTQTEEDNLHQLQWIRLLTPSLIPVYLVEQIKNREYSISDFYKFQNLNCLIHEKGEMKPNPFHHLYVLANEESIIKGYLWFIIDPLTKDVIINTFSVDKEYWYKGKAIKKLVDFMKEFVIKYSLKGVFWMTHYPKHSEKYGFKRSKYILMEYQNG